MSRNWIQRTKDKRGISLKDAVMLYSSEYQCKEYDKGDFFIGSLSRGDAWMHRHGRGGYGSSTGAVFTDYRYEWTDAQRIISLLCNAIMAMDMNPKITPAKVVQELRKIDFFYCGAFPGMPGDHEEAEQ